MSDRPLSRARILAIVLALFALCLASAAQEQWKADIDKFTAAECRKDKRLAFGDVSTPMLNAKGDPRPKVRPVRGSFVMTFGCGCRVGPRGGQSSRPC
jgi:hypothetical protein